MIPLTPMEVGDVTGASFKDWVLIIAGNVFIVIFVIRALGSFAKREWGMLVVDVLAAVLIGFFIYANEQSMSLIKGLGTLIFG